MSVKNKYIFYNDGLRQPNTDDSGPIVHCPMELPITAGCEPGTIVTPLVLRCSVLDHCSTQESNIATQWPLIDWFYLPVKKTQEYVHFKNVKKENPKSEIYFHCGP